MADQIDAPEETRDLSTVVCPWCGHRHMDGWEMVNFRTEDMVDGECSDCEKPIRYRVYVSNTYICEPVTE